MGTVLRYLTDTEWRAKVKDWAQRLTRASTAAERKAVIMEMWGERSEEEASVNSADGAERPAATAGRRDRTGILEKDTLQPVRRDPHVQRESGPFGNTAARASPENAGKGQGGDPLTYHLVFRIRQQYYDAIVAGSKTSEIRRASEFWEVRVKRLNEAAENKQPVQCVFISPGRPVHRRLLKTWFRHPDAVSALGREPSDQGKLDLGVGPVYEFTLGEVVT